MDGIKEMKKSTYLEKGLKLKLSENISAKINQQSSFANFSPKEIILLEGVKATNLYFIIKGIVRGYYIDESGNDITKYFSSENEFFSTETLRTGSASTFAIECIEGCSYNCFAAPIFPISCS